MTLPFDPSKPEARPNRAVFWTDDDTYGWLLEQSKQHDLELSLICHRIVKQARQNADPSMPRRRASDAA